MGLVLLGTAWYCLVLECMSFFMYSVNFTWPSQVIFLFVLFLCQLEKVESREEATTKEVERLHNVLYENTGVRRSFLEVLLFISNELIFFIIVTLTGKILSCYLNKSCRQ